MPEPLLYDCCLQKVSHLLKDGFWKSNQENPFRFLPPSVVQDLISAVLNLKHPQGFKAAHLELLLTSGRVRKFEVHNKNVERELGLALKYLASSSRNLEVIKITNLSNCEPYPTEALQVLIKNSPNLKYIHSEVEFDLKVLRKCRKIQKILLHFDPRQPWYDFLEVRNNCLQTLDSLELFTICLSSFYEFQTAFSDYIVTLIRHCPDITSFGCLETSIALVQLYQAGISPLVKLRTCCWGKLKYPDLDTKWILDAMRFHPFVEELFTNVYSSLILEDLGKLRYLVLLDIHINVKTDLTELFSKTLRLIRYKLKYLSLSCKHQMDFSVVLQNCPKLEALELRSSKYEEFASPTVSLPNLKYLTLHGNLCEKEGRVLSLFSGCNNLTELFLLNARGITDEVLEEFVKKNSLSNLKIAHFTHCSVTDRGYRKLLLDAPRLEKIEASNEGAQALVSALMDTGHKALHGKNIVSMFDRFFAKRRSCHLF